jgi:glutathione synthase/RimK-type ligase-like ATP-grasp enzyme
VTHRIAIATCDALLPDGDRGDGPLFDHLHVQGVQPTVVSWSDPAVEWDSFDLTLIRSTWDYSARRADFLAWLASVPRLHNPAEVVAANTDKVYLRALAAAGVPVVPTVFVEPGEEVLLPEAGEFVIKPSVGAGSRGAGRFAADQAGDLDRAAKHAEQLHGAGRTLMIQPYLAGVDTAGETALIFLDGEFSHSIRKGRMLGQGDSFEVDGPSLFIEENISPCRPSAAELDTAGRALDQLAPDGPLLYARIDLIPSDDGPVVIEAELTEPSLFLDVEPAAAQRLATAILARLG